MRLWLILVLDDLITCVMNGVVEMTSGNIVVGMLSAAFMMVCAMGTRNNSRTTNGNECVTPMT